jgi:hypothetical protein
MKRSYGFESNHLEAMSLNLHLCVASTYRPPIITIKFDCSRYQSKETEAPTLNFPNNKSSILLKAANLIANNLMFYC